MTRLVRFNIPYPDETSIPLEYLEELHRKYWKFIGDHELDYKPWIILSTSEPLDADCFACLYGSRVNPNETNSSSCHFCPLSEHKGRVCGCLFHGSPYEKWRKNPTKENAYAIAEMEWEGVDVDAGSTGP